jgi:hypothetical protein
MSPLLREIEVGTFNELPDARGLFTPPDEVFPAAIQETITHWSIATGRDVKARPVSVAPATAAPIRPTPSPIVAAAPSGNGRAAVTSRETLPV